MHNDRIRLITRDVFDLADRIKEVDDEYRLYYNLDHERYEVHKRGEIAITWTEPLSAALIVKLRETHVRRRTELLREIERAEAQAERDAESLRKERIGASIEHLMSSAWRKS